MVGADDRNIWREIVERKEKKRDEGTTTLIVPDLLIHTDNMGDEMDSLD